MNTNYNNTINFNARIGSNLKSHLIKNNFKGDLNKYSEFESAFKNSLLEFVDENTTIEMSDNKSKTLFLFHPAFRGFVSKLKIKLKIDADNLLQNTVKWDCCFAEKNMFRKIFLDYLNKGKTLAQIKGIAESALDSERRPYFDDYIDSAKRILQKNPKAKITEAELSCDMEENLRMLLSEPEIQTLLAGI